MGSVKDLEILMKAFANRRGRGEWNLSNRTSVFDWGELPDHIENKGASLAMMSAFNFENLRKRGIGSHYTGLVSSEGNVVSFNEASEDGGSNIMRFELVPVYHPIPIRSIDEDGKENVEYDYSFFEKNRGSLDNYLIPLEIIFRNGLPKGSSVFRKIARAKEIEDEYEKERALRIIYDKLGINEEPSPGDMLPEPVMGYTTKLESGDRHLTDEEAYRISGLTFPQFENVREIALKVNAFISEQAEKTGLVNYDGKVEMVVMNGTPVLCDVVGTIDENRFSFNGEQLSKEVIRQWYETNQPEFHPACDEWKKTGEGWQEKCPVKPVALPDEFATLISQMYMSGCNRYVEREIFDSPPLEQVMDDLRPYR